MELVRRFRSKPRSACVSFFRATGYRETGRHHENCGGYGGDDPQRCSRSRSGRSGAGVGHSCVCWGADVHQVSVTLRGPLASSCGETCDWFLGTLELKMSIPHFQEPSAWRLWMTTYLPRSMVASARALADART